MSKSTNEDRVPDVKEEYPYLWSKGSSKVTLDEFLKKKPSMVQDDGTKPWIWVQSSESSKEDVSIDAAIEEATALLKEVTEKVEKVKNDASIPTRSNKKTGAKSKGQIREQIQSEAAEKLKEISIRNGYVSGKWLMFAPPDKVDMIWSKLATSLVSGPLSLTCAFLAKVSTSPRNDTSSYQHVMCLYMPDAYDKDAVTEVMKILLRTHGLNLSGVKTNLYTSIGLSSKHPSGIQSTVWRNTALLDDSEIKELKNAFFAELNMSQSSAPVPTEKNRPDKTGGDKTKTKPKLKKKVADDNPFASDDESAGGNKAAVTNDDDNDSGKDGEPKSRTRQMAKKAIPPSKKAVPPSKKAVLDADDGEGPGSDDRKAKKSEKTAPVKRPHKSARKRVQSDDSKSDTEDENRPRKKVLRSKTSSSS